MVESFGIHGRKELLIQGFGRKRGAGGEGAHLVDIDIDEGILLKFGMK